MSDIQVVTVAGTQSLAELDRLRKAYPSTGLYPILFGDEEEHERILENKEFTPNASVTLERSRIIELPRWFDQKRSAEPDLFQFDEGDWPESTQQEMGIITHQDILSGNPKPQVAIGLLRIAAPWEAFAYLGWGSWNDCPSPEEHCAVHRYWATQYGAEVVSITGDVVQCVVDRPPKDRTGALRLAHEQYVNCYDIVEQGTETIAALAAGLLNSHSWYFWWD